MTDAADRRENLGDQLADLTEDQRESALARWRVLRAHLEDGSPLVRVAAEENVPERTLRRWLADYRDGGLAALARRPRSDKGTRKMPPELKLLIEGLALRRPAPTTATVHRQVADVAREQGWPVPSYAAVHDVVRGIDPAMAVLAHEGSKRYKEVFDLVYRREAGKPNEIWQADHTLLDLWVVTPSGKPARPWLTIIEDDHSRAVAGYAVNLGAPSALQTALAFRQAIWRKPHPDRHVCGIPGAFHVDHGSDFTSLHIVLRTLFGTLRLESPRYKACPCGTDSSATVSPVAALLPERTTPELLLQEAKYAALTSYGSAATLLGESFPLGRELHATAVRQQVESTATRLEDELGEERFSFIGTCPAEWEELPRPDLPLVVTLDGGYVHSSNQTSRKDGWFEAVTGTSNPASGGPAKAFAWVQAYDDKPKRRLYELLRSQGRQDNQQVVFLTDGGEDIRDIPCYLNPQSERYIDWFHIAMRLTVLRQMTRSLPAWPDRYGDDDDAPWIPDPGQADRDLERVKHFLWHGNTFRATGILEELRDDFDTAYRPDADDKQRAFFQRLSEFCTYIGRNSAEIPNYGERYRCGEPISTATAEATVNRVISRRMVKKQQMRWSPCGAHLVPQVRTRVLNDDLAADFARWYPGFAAPAQRPVDAAWPLMISPRGTASEYPA